SYRALARRGERCGYLFVSWRARRRLLVETRGAGHVCRIGVRSPRREHARGNEIRFGTNDGDAPRCVGFDRWNVSIRGLLCRRLYLRKLRTRTRQAGAAFKAHHRTRSDKHFRAHVTGASGPLDEKHEIFAERRSLGYRTDLRDALWYYWPR